MLTPAASKVVIDHPSCETMIAGTGVDLDQDPPAVRRLGRVELSFVVVGGNHDAATLAPFRIESVVVADPSPDRVITRIHLGQPTLQYNSTFRTRGSSMARNIGRTSQVRHDRKYTRLRAGAECAGPHSRRRGRLFPVKMFQRG